MPSPEPKRTNPVLNTIRSIAFYGLVSVWTLVLGVGYIVYFALPRRFLQNCGALYCRGLLLILRLTVGLTHEVRGRENLPPPPYILACKHQSAWETLALPALIDRPAIVLKRSLYKLPVFGWYLRAAGMIGIERKAGAKALRMMIAEAKAAAVDRRPILIFPEGTRTPPGQSRRFHIGVTALYDSLHIPVVPVALNSGVYWPRDSLTKRPGRIVLQILPALPADLSRAELTDRLHTAINSQSDRLLAEAQGWQPPEESLRQPVDNLVERKQVERPDNRR